MKLVRLILLPLLLAISTPMLAESILLDRAVAIVNNEIITQTQVDQLLSSIKLKAARTNQSLPAPSELESQVLNRLINESLQLQLAKQMGISVSDSQLDTTISNLIKSEYQDRETLLKELEEDNSSYSKFREKIRNELMIGEVRRNQVQRRITVSQQETQALVNELNTMGDKDKRYQIGHILMLASDSDLTEIQTQAQIITEQLKRGDDIHQLALAYSQGPKALEGGDWGFMTLSEMPTLFAEVVSDSKSGDVIGPFRSSRGLHIIKVMSIEGEQTVEVTEVNARHILIKPSIILTEEKAKEQLEQIRADIIAGKGPFSVYAKQYSQDPGSAVKGGALGWADPKIFVPAFRETLSQMSPGEISEPFRSTFGWHIIKLLEKRTTDVTEQSKEERAYRIIYNRKFNEEAEFWLNELREEAYVELVGSRS